jgi:hypothetical protein
VTTSRSRAGADDCQLAHCQRGNYGQGSLGDSRERYTLCQLGEGDAESQHITRSFYRHEGDQAGFQLVDIVVNKADSPREADKDGFERADRTAQDATERAGERIAAGYYGAHRPAKGYQRLVEPRAAYAENESLEAAVHVVEGGPYRLVDGDEIADGAGQRITAEGRAGRRISDCAPSFAAPLASVR